MKTKTLLKFIAKHVHKAKLEIVAIDGVNIVGWCEDCLFPILDGEKKGPYLDVDICSDCMKA